MASKKKARLAKMAKGRKFWAGIYSALGIGTGFQQLIEKDVQSWVQVGLWQRLTGENKLKALASRALDRLTGISIFPDQAAPIHGPTFNPWGIFNKWTGLGAGMIVYSAISRGFGLKLPHAGKLARIGSSIATGGAVGGFFDPPPNAGQAVGPNAMELQVGPRRSAW